MKPATAGAWRNVRHNQVDCGGEIILTRDKLENESSSEQADGQTNGTANKRQSRGDFRTGIGSIGFLRDVGNDFGDFERHDSDRLAT